MSHEYKKICEALGYKMVNMALNEAKKSAIPVIRCHTSSKCALNNKIKELEGIVL